MADIKISALAAASSVALTDEFETNQSGTSRKATALQVHQAVSNTYPLMNYGGYQFDGSTDYLDGNALTGIADGKKGTFVAVVRFANAASAHENIYAETGTRFDIRRTSGGNLQVIATNAAAATILQIITTNADLSAAGTYRIMVSWDLAVAGSARIYIDGVSKAITETTFTDDTIDYTVSEHSVGATTGGANFLTGDVYLVWFDPTSALEFNTESVRRKFIDVNGIPLFLGSHGELPTGTPPILFLAYDDFNNWPRNRGLATTTFVENGTPGAVGTTLYGQAAVVDAVAQAAVKTTAVGNVGTGEDNLIAHVLQANTLNAHRKGVRITAWGSTANNANAKTLKVYFGSQVILTNSLTTSVAGVWRVESEVISTGVDAQDWVSQLVTTGTAGVALNDVEIGTATQDDGATITVKCTGEATSNNDIVQEGLLVEVIGA